MEPSRSASQVGVSTPTAVGTPLGEFFDDGISTMGNLSEEGDFGLGDGRDPCVLGTGVKFELNGLGLSCFASFQAQDERHSPNGEGFSFAE
jgi:hypothetical protein